MLTGDKGETARMIGISCGILSSPTEKSVKQFIIDGENQKLEEVIEMANGSQKFELLISGSALSKLLSKS
jgi:magnesium-transporting ATPase (P-type)